MSMACTAISESVLTAAQKMPASEWFNVSWEYDSSLSGGTSRKAPPNLASLLSRIWLAMASNKAARRSASLWACGISSSDIPEIRIKRLDVAQKHRANRWSVGKL